MVKSAVLGYPRVGVNRAVKKVCLTDGCTAHVPSCWGSVNVELSHLRMDLLFPASELQISLYKHSLSSKEAALTYRRSRPTGLARSPRKSSRLRPRLSVRSDGSRSSRPVSMLSLRTLPMTLAAWLPTRIAADFDSGEFTLYDHLLDHSFNFGVIPQRYVEQKLSPQDTYFGMLISSAFRVHATSELTLSHGPWSPGQGQGHRRRCFRDGQVVSQPLHNIDKNGPDL